MLSGAFFTYLFLGSICYSDYKNFGIKKAFRPFILSLTSAAYCISVSVTILSTSTPIACAGAATANIFGYLGLIFYFLTMSDYLKIPKSKWDKILYPTLWFLAGVGVLLLLEALVFKTQIFVKPVVSDVYIFSLSKVMGVPSNVLVSFLMFGLLLSLIKIVHLIIYAFLRKSSFWIFAGLFTSILFQANDLISMGFQLQYAIPLAGYMYLIEIIRITYIYHKEAMSQTGVLEQQVKSLSSIANMAYVAGSINHDLKNHLTKALMAMDFLKRNYSDIYNNDASFKKWLDKAITSNSRIASLSSNYLKLLRGSPSEKAETFSLNEAILVVKELTSDVMYQNEIKLGLPSLSNEVQIFANKTLFEQALINLTNNAIDAVKDSVDAWIEISWKKTDTEVVIRVTDSGDGIPVDVHPKIFDRGESSKADGNGLGLWLTREIVQEMKGSVNYLAEEKHTCFEIVLPLAQ
jgi:signal transduction histidine kinase